MYSSEDLEIFYFQYQTECLPNGESVQSFCKRNKVPYNIFQKWYKNTCNKIVEVQVEGLLAVRSSGNAVASTKSPLENDVTKGSDVRIRFELCVSNGLRLSQKNLSYRDMVHLIERLEGLC